MAAILACKDRPLVVFTSKHLTCPSLYGDGPTKLVDTELREIWRIITAEDPALAGSSVSSLVLVGGDIKRKRVPVPALVQSLEWVLA